MKKEEVVMLDKINLKAKEIEEDILEDVSGGTGRSKVITCPTCNGKGNTNGRKCPVCNGKGVVEK